MRSVVAVFAWALVPGPILAGAEPPAVHDYQVIVWCGDQVSKAGDRLPLFVERMKSLGVTTFMVTGDEDPARWNALAVPYYVENIVNRGLCLKWNSQVKDWDAFVTRWHREGRPESAFHREYCLVDPEWRRFGREKMIAAGRRHASSRPRLYDIRDELSVTLSANPFDYDFSPGSLAAFRTWLKTRHGDLGPLNRAWGTDFAAMDLVVPFSTDRIKHRIASGEALPKGKPDWQAVARMRFDPREARQRPAAWNLAPWCDFRSFMDDCLAESLDDFRQALKTADPRGLAGIEGTQMPHAFGGYDLWKLSRVLDWVEPYDIANAREIFASFMPGAPLFATYGEDKTDPALRRLWHTRLLGDVGAILWWSEDLVDWRDPALALTAKGKALQPALQAMHSPESRALTGARRLTDRVYILYSQPSIQVEWLLGSFEDGATWHRRFSSYEASHNRGAKVRNAWLKVLQDLGYSPVFISSDELANGRLRMDSQAVLVLPDAWALSGKEVDEIRAFVSETGRGNVLLWSGEPGCFDENGRLREQPPFSQEGLADLSAHSHGAWRAGERAQVWDGDVAEYARERLKPGPDPSFPRKLAATLPSPPDFQPEDPSARVLVHRLQTREGLLLAVERNIQYDMNEDLKQGGGNEALERPLTLRLLDRRRSGAPDIPLTVPAFSPVFHRPDPGARP